MSLRTVVIVDDHAMFRTGVRAELGTTVEVLAEAADVDQAVAAVIKHQPEVVLLDVHLPGGGGAEVMRRCALSQRSATSGSPTRFLALSVSDAAEDVIGTIRAGARGYVTKTITGPELVAAIERVASGDAVFSPRLAGFVLDAFAGTIEVAAVDEDLDRLTEREREVMRLIARGYSPGGRTIDDCSDSRATSRTARGTRHGSLRDHQRPRRPRKFVVRLVAQMARSRGVTEFAQPALLRDQTPQQDFDWPHGRTSFP